MQEKRNIYKYSYNKCDFIIRFFYTQVPILRNCFQRIMFWRIYYSNFRHLDDIFMELKEIFAKYNITFQNKQIIELGPGNSIILALNCLCNGAKKYQMVDKYPRISMTNKQVKHLFDQIIYVEKKYNCKIDNYINKNNLNFNKEYLEFIPTGVEDLKKIESHSIDIIISINVFEHVKDVEKSIKEMKRVLINGGIMYHIIDLRDHFNFSEPFKFLKYSDYIWDNLLTREGYSYTNRLRVDDFEKLLEKYGFEIIEIKKDISQLNLPETQKFIKKFREKNIEFLKVVGIRLLAKNIFN